MKIALLTWFHYHNYGTALQVSALCNIIQKAGHAVDVVNYCPNGTPVLRPTDGLLRHFSKKALKKLKSRGQRTYTAPQREALFDAFYDEHLTFTEPCSIFSDFRALNDTYEAFVCGSDQIWAPSCFDPRYFLDFAEESDRMIAYAPSVGLPRIADPDVAAEMKRLTARFGSLSTREASGSALIAELIGRPVATVLDPTLLLDAEDWSQLTATDTPDDANGYVLAYFLRDNPVYWQKVYALAAQLKLPVKVIPVFTSDIPRNGCITEPIGPREFVQLIKHAAFVCTDSFHGTVFALNFEREFFTFERFKAKEGNNQNSRIYNILGLTGLKSRLVNEKRQITVPAPIDYAPIRERLAAERHYSLAYLTTAFEKAANCEKKPLKHIGKESDVCCGCSACASACPTGAITMEVKNGFYTAVVNEALCIHCGKCTRVCPFYGAAPDNRRVREASLLSYKDNDTALLQHSSSGGIGYRLAQLCLQQGYTVTGCVFNAAEHKAEHIVVRPDAPEQLERLRGSKYMQSDFSSAMKEIAEGDGPLAVFGTPCQIAAARRMAPKGRQLLYIDLICHGVPTGAAYAKYLQFLEEKHGLAPDGLETVFRLKQRGWHQRYIFNTDGKKTYCEHQDHDPYFLLFESSSAYTDACYTCRWRASSEADIRIGDYWGTPFAEDETGVSMVGAFTDAGAQLINQLAADGELRVHDNEDYFKYQQSVNLPMPVFYRHMLEGLEEPETPLEETLRLYVRPFRRRKKCVQFAKQAVRVAKKVIKRS